MRVLWAVGGLLVSTSALADDVRYSLQAHHLVADVDGTSIMVDFPCDEGYAVVAKGNFVFVACGAQGVAVYDAHDRSHPTFKGRSLYEHPCLDLTADGECLAERHVTYSAPVPNVLSTAAPQRREPVPYVLRTAGTAAPLRREPVDTSVRDAGIACVAIGGAAFLVGVVIDVAQMVSAFNGFCLFGCASQSGPPAAVGWAGFATWTLGLGVALVGIPLWVGGARHHVAAYATFGGGGVRFAF